MFGAKKRKGNFETLNVTGSGSIGQDLNITGTVVASNFQGGTYTSTDLELADGSAALPSLSFLHDSASGIYRDTSGSNGLGVSTYGTKKLKIDNTSATFSIPVSTGTQGLTC